MRVSADARNFRLLGFALSRLGATGEAVQCLERAVALAPSDWCLVSELARLLSCGGQHERAREAVLRVPVECRTAEILNRLGEIEHRLGNDTAAEAAFRAALAAAPQDEYYMYNLGIVLETRDLPEAYRLFNEAVGIDPQYHEARAALGRVEIKRGKFQRGADLLFEALDADNDCLEQIADAVEFCIAKGRLAKAMRLLDGCLARGYDDWRVRMQRGWVFMDSDDQVMAAAEFQAAIALEPELPPGYYFLARVHMNEGQIADAIPILEKALSLDPDYGTARRALSEAQARHDPDRQRSS